MTSLTSSEFVLNLRVAAVHSVGVNHRRNRIKLLPWTETTIVSIKCNANQNYVFLQDDSLPQTWHDSSKVHAVPLVKIEELVIRGNVNRETVRVRTLQSDLAALGGLSCFLVPRLGGECDVVVHELTPGHQHHGDSVVMEPIILVDSCGH